ncbi:CBM21 domain-containing protein [Mycena indigotica]|uniref:CBM21 domain-containing protein n=1 Tax=Mycena indigotica TaxID=2126181 RepID=A0A8H6S512_9AGAR|nr:CBM21 domain-containing protein [Mycena indigotica]KAF7292181.1 CBM21 domain-containing protein [Mycena indigotica]
MDRTVLCKGFAPPPPTPSSCADARRGGYRVAPQLAITILDALQCPRRWRRCAPPAYTRPCPPRPRPPGPPPLVHVRPGDKGPRRVQQPRRPPAAHPAHFSETIPLSGGRRGRELVQQRRAAGDVDDGDASLGTASKGEGDGRGGRPPPRRSDCASCLRFWAPRPRPPRSPQRSPNSSFIGVPFPRSGSPAPTTPPIPVRPALPGRASSQPVILLANGKPLKSSLKSSRSAPHVPSHHLRARSAPSTPALSPSGTGTPEEAEEEHDPAAFAAALGLEGEYVESPSTPKAVHFPPPDDGLETVRVFKRTARPASVSFPLGAEDETETETETDSGVRWVSSAAAAAAGREGGRRTVSSPLNPSPRMAEGEKAEEWRYVVDAPGIPRARDGASMVVLESVTLETPPGELHLRGTLLVRNAAFEKHVFVRFTLDGWLTTSEVAAKYLASTPSGDPGPGWDRFGFSIRLTDYAHVQKGRGLVGRELEMVARFCVPWVAEGGAAPYVWCDPEEPREKEGERRWLGTGAAGPGEWWDNNGGRNYRVGFRSESTPAPAPATTTSPAPGPPPTSAPPSVPTSTIPFPRSSPQTLSPLQPPLTTLPVAGPVPPPPPPRTAHAQALAAKLGRLSLRNYAAPAPRPSSWAGFVHSSPPREQSSPPRLSPLVINEPLPAANAQAGVGLYWPWGRTATTPEVVVTEVPEDESDSDREGDGNSLLAERREEETPPTSPLGARGLAGLLEAGDGAGGERGGEGPGGARPADGRGDEQQRVPRVRAAVVLRGRGVGGDMMTKMMKMMTTKKRPRPLTDPHTFLWLPFYAHFAV